MINKNVFYSMVTAALISLFVPPLYGQENKVQEKRIQKEEVGPSKDHENIYAPPVNLPVWNLYTIEEVNQQKLSFGTYHVEGYVIKNYKCPPCPEGAMCKPCMPHHMIISQDNKVYDYDVALTNKELMVFTSQDQILKENEYYRFLIQILDVKTSDHNINNVKLIYYERIENHEQSFQ